MATLSGTHRTGKSVWQHCIIEQPNALEILYDIVPDTMHYLWQYNGKKYYRSDFKLFEGQKVKLLSKELVGNEKRVKRYVLAEVDGTRGFVPLRAILKPTINDPLHYERSVVRKLDRLIKLAGGLITLVVRDHNNQTKFYVPNCIGAEQWHGYSIKADMIIRTSNPLERIFITHKASGGPQAFQQYSGITEVAGVPIHNHPSVQLFFHQTIKYIKSERLKRPLYAKIRDTRLQNCAIFGPDFVTQKYGPNNVHMLCQGEPVLTPYQKVFFLSWTNGHVCNGSVNVMKGDYEPIFGATYRIGRGFNFEGQRYLGARVGIVPFAMMKGRRDLLDITDQLY